MGKMKALLVCLLAALLIERASGYVSAYDGPVAGNRMLSECVSGGATASAAGTRASTTAMIEGFGYPAEEHVVLTEDGYLLTVHRIPGRAGAAPVLLQHGILSSSFDWVVSAFLLADRGYDVWIGNSRGNSYCRCHVEFETFTAKFWDFSWHEMAVHDLPAVITHITNIAKQSLVYIGFSMGTITSYVMAAERPDIASKVKVIFSLSPVAYVAHAQSSLRIFIPFTREMEYFAKLHGEIRSLSRDPVFKQIIKYTCTGALWQRKLCLQLVFPMVGHDDAQFNYTLLPVITSHSPDGTSLKTVTHSYQLRTSGRFQRYDYGPATNSIVYSSERPPEYDLSKIQVPVALIYSENDYISHPEDVKKLSEILPNVILDHKVEHPRFNHIDFMFAIDADKYVYSKILSVLKTFH